MKAYKGFNKDLTCRGFQYEIGKTYEEPEANLCMNGFHACTAPLDVFNYYTPAESRYHEVDLEEVSDETSDDSKCVGKKITIGAEIGIPGLVKAHIEWVKAQIQDTKANTGDRSAATNTGNYSAATNTGNYSAAEVNGKDSIAIACSYASKAKGALGCAIVVAERGNWNGETYPLLNICAAIVDGEKIKADTWYTAKDGKLVEWKEED